jgi:hypothetical protein
VEKNKPTVNQLLDNLAESLRVQRRAQLLEQLQQSAVAQTVQFETPNTVRG